MDSDSQIYSAIYQQFMGCPVQTLAFETICSEMLNSRMIWQTHSKSGNVRDQRAVEPYSTQMLKWRLIIRDVLLSLTVWGYVLYRVVAPKEQDKRPDHHETGAHADCPDPSGTDGETVFPRVEVLNGQLYRLKWSKKHNEWCAVDMDAGTNLNSKTRKKWKLLVFAPPFRVGADNKLVLASPSAKAYQDSRAFHCMFENLYRRDEFNTNPQIYTNMQRDIRSVGGNRPWFSPADVHGSMQGVPGVTHMDFETLVSDRLETINHLGALSHKARLDTLNLYRPIQKCGGTPTEEAKRPAAEHSEHFVTDGFDYQEVSYRRGPERGIDVLDRLLNQMLFSWQVPPQVLGKNINSERLASSNRLSEMAIGRYDSFIKALRVYIGTVIKDISLEISGDPSRRTWCTIEACVTIHTLQKIQQFLVPKKIKELYACVYDMPESVFDSAALATHQQMLLSGGKPGGEAATRDKPKMTEDQKEEKMLKKAQDPMQAQKNDA